MTKPTKIIRLEAENIKRLRAVQVTPQGNLITVGGKNANGKTSLLDSIAMALGGAASTPDQPIRASASTAHVVVETDDLIIERRYSVKNSPTLVVRTRDGKKLSSPQAVLDKLTARIAFDPLAFVRMDPRKQAETLRLVSGVDVSAIEEKRAKLYADRTEFNRDADRIKARLAGEEVDLNAPDDEIDSAQLLEELSLVQECDALATRITEIETDLARTKKKLTTLHSARKSDTPAEELKSRLAGVESTNRTIRAKRAYLTQKLSMDDLLEESRKLTASITALDREKAQALASSKMPVEGLAFDPDGVTYQGVPFSQCSAAEQMRVSMAVALAMNPSLRVCLIRDGSLLDSDSLEIIREMAEAADAQVWLERVSEGADCQVIIEDGAIAAPKPKKPAAPAAQAAPSDETYDY